MDGPLSPVIISLSLTHLRSSIAMGKVGEGTVAIVTILVIINPQ